MDSVRLPRNQRRMRVVIEGIGIVDIDRGLFTADGKPRVRVDVISDFDRFGPAPDGLRYVVSNGDPGPGVVFVTGEQHPPVDPDVAEAHAEGEHAFCLPGCGGE
jgi:hypothetical protein